VSLLGQAQGETLEEPGDEPELAIPEEPPIEGGILSEKTKTDLEPRAIVDTSDSLPFDDLPPHANCTHSLSRANKAQFLVDDALNILSSISYNHSSLDTPSSSKFVRLLFKFMDLLKSLSLLASSSQEEPLHAMELRNEHLTKALNLLTQAAAQQNPDALYLLGHLNFVRSPTSRLT